MSDLTADQHAAQEWGRDFAQRFVAPVALELDRDPESPARDALVREAARAGMLGLALPAEMGGSGLDPVASVLVTEELAYACAGCAVLIGATGLGLSPILLSLELDAIQRFVTPLAASWTTDAPQLAALAATEPETGSDFIFGHPAARVRTRVEPRDGGYVVNGTKIFISNGSIADLVTVFGTLDPSGPVRESCICLAVPADTPGFSVGQVFDKMGQRASPAAELVFDDVFVPADHCIGAPGAGWALNRLIMSVTRTPVAAIALGIARRAYDEALTYGEARVQGGHAIAGHQAMQVMLADMAIRVEAARGLVLASARAAAAGAPSLRLASIAKTFAADAAVANALDAIQVLGGHGYIRDNGVEKLLRDAKLTQIYEGTNQVNRFEIVEAALAERAAPAPPPPTGVSSPH